MAHRYMIYSWNQGESSKALAQALGTRRIRHHRSNYHARRGDALINWGATAMHLPARLPWGDIPVLNPPGAVALVSNKLAFFRHFKDTGLVPQFWDNRVGVLNYLNTDNGRDRLVVARTVLNGHAGAGIRLVRPGDELPPAQLYTKYHKKDHEYRVHMFSGRCIFVQRKARKIDVPDDQVNWQIRNHENGFIFAHKNLNVPEEVLQVARNAAAHLPLLDFGAYDIIYSAATKTALLLEVNSAPGMEGTTLEKYKEAFLDALPNL